MSFSIQFAWRNKVYSALVNEQRVSNVQLWIAEFPNNKMYILSKSRSGWCCDELKEELSKAIGRAIDQELTRQPSLKRYDA
jgi:frataxin-like iron-binding protein CyaY